MGQSVCDAQHIVGEAPHVTLSLSMVVRGPFPGSPRLEPSQEGYGTFHSFSHKQVLLFLTREAGYLFSCSLSILTQVKPLEEMSFDNKGKIWSCRDIIVLIITTFFSR